MATFGEFSVRHKPRSVSDTIEGDNSPPGAMTSLSNLIPDPTTPNCYVCRPANTTVIDFTAWAALVPAGTPDVVTVAYQVGDIIYGLIGITTGVFAGHDYPFVYNTATSAFVAVAAVVLADTPVSQATTGDWIPPQMTLTGVQLFCTHIGFPGGGGAFFGWFDITNPAVPTWNVGNTTGNALPTVPQACGTFNNRTRFACGNVAYYTDTLSVNMTAGTQSQTLGDYTPIVSFAPLPVSNTSQAIIQGLIAFKLTNIWLITGDAATTNLGANELSSSVGTAAPRSAVSTPEGIKFMSNDGIRLINFFGVLSEPDEDLAFPFINALTPSRACAAFNADTYRICVQNGIVAGSPYEDYWYNFRRRCWTGPHTFRYDIAVPLSNNFVLASNALPAKMWNSFSVQGKAGVGNTFTENGTALQWTYTSCPMTDLNNIYANAALRTTLELALPASGQSYNFTAQNESGTSLSTAVIQTPTNQAVWGAFNWGAANWGAVQTGLVPLTIPWISSVVFNKLSIMANGPSALGIKIGSLRIAYKRLNYLLN